MSDITEARDRAHELVQELKKSKYMLNYSFLQIGKVLHEIQSTKAYKLMDHSSFTSFLADPEYGQPKSTAYLHITIYRFFIEQHGLDENDIIDIDVVRLRDIIPVIKAGGDLTEWLDKAKYLGKGDFINEVRVARGKKEIEIKFAKPNEDEEPVIPTAYLSLVKASPCCVCGARPVDPHHFPKTKGAGNMDDKVIPLCRGCHIQIHQDDKEFAWIHRVKIMGWFYDLIFHLIDERRNG